MFKAGDRVVLVESGGGWDGYNVGNEGVVMSMSQDEIIATVRFDTSDPKGFDEDWGRASKLKIVSKNTTFSIPADTDTVTLKFSDGSTQDLDVKDRARGVPEWVKDGAWVVNKISGVIARISAARVGFDVEYLSGLSYNFSASDVHERFRPFTNSDWEWGMWAEYKREKVFVMNSIDKTGCVEISVKPIYLKTLDGWNLAPASELTPTTAP